MGIKKIKSNPSINHRMALLFLHLFIVRIRYFEEAKLNLGTHFFNS